MIRYWWKKSKTTQTAGEIYHIHNWKNQYCENDYTIQSNLQIQCNSYQITNVIFLNQNKKFYSLYRNTKDSKQSKQSWERKTELEESGSMTSDYTTKLQKSRQCGAGTLAHTHTHTNADQWNRTESPEMNQHTYDNLIYDKRDKYIQWTRYSLCNKWCCKMWTATCKRMKSRPFPNNIHKNKLKMD